MLSMKEIRPNVFELVESILGWTDTKKTSWFYDLNEMLVSEKPDFPKGMYTRELTNQTLSWFNVHYRPLLEE